MLMQPSKHKKSSLPHPSSVDRTKNPCHVIHARILPAGKQKHESFFESYDGFTQEEARKLSLIGIPVSIEHKSPSICIGHVTKNWMHTDGSVFIEASIYNTMDGLFASESIFDRYFDVSLSHAFYSVKRGNDQYYIKKPVEVSLCKQGRRPGTHIFQVIKPKYDENNKITLEQHISASDKKKGPQNENNSTDYYPPDVYDIIADLEEHANGMASAKENGTDFFTGKMKLIHSLPKEVQDMITQYKDLETKRDPSTGTLPPVKDHSMGYIVTRIGSDQPLDANENQKISDTDMAIFKDMIHASLKSGGKIQPKIKISKIDNLIPDKLDIIPSKDDTSLKKSLPSHSMEVQEIPSTGMSMASSKITSTEGVNITPAANGMVVNPSVITTPPDDREMTDTINEVDDDDTSETMECDPDMLNKVLEAAANTVLNNSDIKIDPQEVAAKQQVLMNLSKVIKMPDMTAKDIASLTDKGMMILVEASSAIEQKKSQNQLANTIASPPTPQKQKSQSANVRLSVNQLESLMKSFLDEKAKRNNETRFSKSTPQENQTNVPMNNSTKSTPVNLSSIKNSGGSTISLGQQPLPYVGTQIQPMTSQYNPTLSEEDMKKFAMYQQILNSQASQQQQIQQQQSVKPVSYPWMNGTVNVPLNSQPVQSQYQNYQLPVQQQQPMNQFSVSQAPGIQNSNPVGVVYKDANGNIFQMMPMSAPTNEIQGQMVGQIQPQFQGQYQMQPIQQGQMQPALGIQQPQQQQHLMLQQQQPQPAEPSQKDIFMKMFSDFMDTSNLAPKVPQSQNHSQAPQQQNQHQAKNEPSAHSSTDVVVPPTGSVLPQQGLSLASNKSGPSAAEIESRNKIINEAISQRGLKAVSHPHDNYEALQQRFEKLNGFQSYYYQSHDAHYTGHMGLSQNSAKKLVKEQDINTIIPPVYTPELYTQLPRTDIIITPSKRQTCAGMQHYDRDVFKRLASTTNTETTSALKDIHQQLKSLSYEKKFDFKRLEHNPYQSFEVLDPRSQSVTV